jgi:hypothetical protein
MAMWADSPLGSTLAVDELPPLEQPKARVTTNVAVNQTALSLFRQTTAVMIPETSSSCNYHVFMYF